MLVFLGPWARTEATDTLARDVAAALDDYFDSRSAAADALGMTLPELSLQLSGQKALTLLWRCTALDVGFWDVLLAVLAKRQGGLYVGPDVVTLLRGAATLRRVPLKARASVAARRTA